MNEKHEENGVIYVSIFVMQTTLNLKLCIQSNLYKKLHFEKHTYRKTWKVQFFIFDSYTRVEIENVSWINQ